MHTEPSPLPLFPSPSLSSCLPRRVLAFSWCIHPAECTQLHGNYRLGVRSGTQQQDAYIIKWTHVQMKLLSQPIKVNYQRQNAAARKREGPAPKLHCINEQHHFWKWRGNTESHLSAQDRARGRERDGTQHWLPNYAFYHFSHNRVPSFFSCPVYSCSCYSAALMRKIKNKHNGVIFTSTDHQITSHCSITHTHTYTQPLNRVKAL